MTIDEAIRALEGNSWKSFTPSGIAINDAMKLGIEALKRLKENREHHIVITYRALIGETKE